MQMQPNIFLVSPARALVVLKTTLHCSARASQRMVRKGGVGVDGSELGLNGHTDMHKERGSHILISSEVSFLFSGLSVSSQHWQLLV